MRHLKLGMSSCFFPMPRADRRPRQFSTLIAAQRSALVLKPLGLVKLKTLVEVKSNRATRLPKLSADECCKKLIFICLVEARSSAPPAPLIVLFGGPYALNTSGCTIRLLGQVWFLKSVGAAKGGAFQS